MPSIVHQAGGERRSSESWRSSACRRHHQWLTLCRNRFGRSVSIRRPLPVRILPPGLVVSPRCFRMRIPPAAGRTIRARCSRPQLEPSEIGFLPGLRVHWSNARERLPGYTGFETVPGCNLFDGWAHYSFRDVIAA